MSSPNNEYKYKIPRNVKASFELGGINKVRLLSLIPFIIPAIILFNVLSGPPSVFLPLILLVIGYMAVTQEFDHETLFEYYTNLIRDQFRPSIHYWELDDHDRYYQKLIKRTEEREQE